MVRMIFPAAEISQQRKQTCSLYLNLYLHSVVDDYTANVAILLT